jgi:hypothetical protein
VRNSSFVAVLACLIWVQLPASSQQSTFESQPAITLSNGKLEATIMVQGSSIARIVLDDDPEKLSPLWDPVRMARELGKPARYSGALGHFVCVDGFGPISDEERAAGLPGHGEAHLQKFEAHTSKAGNATSITLSAKLPIVQEMFTRTFRMVEGENVIYVDSELENLLGFDRPVNWAEHATIGSPFLEPGVTVVDLSGSRSRTRPYQETKNGSTERRLASGQDFTWPMAPGLGQKQINLRETPRQPHYLDHAATLLDPSRQLEWVTALNAKKQMILGYVFRREDYPWLQYWGNYPPTEKMARGMEFGTQPFDVPRREIISMGSLFETPTYRWLPAKSIIKTRFLIYFARVPEGFSKVDDVRMENNHITIEDRSSQKQVVLAASSGLPL